jgi:hypothetical protein
MNLLNGSNPVALVVRRIVAARTVIDAERFGAEFIRAEPVLLDVGFTVDPMRRKVSATDYVQVFAADQAANEVERNPIGSVSGESKTASSSDTLHQD